MTLTVWIAAALVGAAAPAPADQAALLREGERAEREARPADAAAAYARARDLAPGSRLAAGAEARLRWLEERAVDGWEPVAALLRARALPRHSLDAGTLRALENTIASVPPGLVRRELRALVADIWLEALGEPEEAARAYAAWLSEPGLRDSERERAVAGASLAAARSGDIAKGLDALAAAGLDARPEGAHLRYLAFRQVAVPLAIGALCLFAFLAGTLAHTARLRPAPPTAFTPFRLLVAAWALVVPSLLLLSFEPTSSWRAALIAAAAAPLLVLAAMSGPWLRAVGASPRRKLAFAAAAVLAQGAAGLLALDRAGALAALWAQP